MSVPGSRSADGINLDEFERRLRAAGGGHGQAEDPLSELARLVEFSHFGVSSSGTSARLAAEQAKGSADSAAGPSVDSAAGESADPAEPIETGDLRGTIDEEVDEFASGESSADRQARSDFQFGAYRFGEGWAEERAPRRLKLTIAALALAGVAMIGAVFALRGGAHETRKPPFIAAAKGPIKVAPPSSETVAASNDPGSSLLRSNAKPGPVKIVNSEEQPVDLSAQASPGAPANPPPAADAGRPVGSAPEATSLAATVNTRLAAPSAAPPPEFPAPTPVRAVSLRPDGTPIAAAPADQAQSDANSAAAPAAAVSEPAGAAEPSTPKLDLPAGSSPKSSARVEVAKTDTTAPEADVETPGEPARTGARAKRVRAEKKARAAQAAAETTAAAEPPPVDATAATASGEWAVQLGAPRSEKEARKQLARLTSKYSAELNGSPIGVHKAVVKGKTIYRLRVAGFTKADAAALCARVKGEGGACFIAK